MTKKLIGIAAAAMIAVPAWAVITGSEHDFTNTGAIGGAAFNTTSDMCGSCHVPHAPLINVPLWAHALGTGDPFTLYSSNLNYTGGNAAEYNAAELGGSEACLSCHDGTIAVIAAITLDETDRWILYDNEQAGAPPVAVGGLTGLNESLGLKGSHPVMVDYATNIAGTGDFATVVSLDARIILDNGYVQCTTCHNAHDEEDLGVGTGMLNMSNANSAICLECHTK